MMIAVSDSIVTYALKHAINIGNEEEINFICNRISEIVPSMQFALTVQSIQMISDYQKSHNPSYGKYKSLERLQQALEEQRKVFAE